MKDGLILGLAALALLFSVTLAQAGPCAVTVMASNATIAYVPGNPVKPSANTLSTTCTKNGGNTDTYNVYPTTTGTATSGANSIIFTLSKSAACAAGNLWALATPFSFSFSSTGTQTAPFYICIASGQNVAAGSYTNTVTINPTTGIASSIIITILAPANCTFASFPGITLAYGNAFRGTAATATTSAPVTCTNTLPYTMAVSPISGVSAGINYSLALSPATGTGTGASQGITITATAPAGQAGTCATGTCTGVAQAHTLTVTY